MKNKTLLALALCTLMVGCITPPSGSSANTQYYRLRYIQQQNVTDNQQPQETSVLVKVLLPEVLDSQRMVYFKNDYEVAYKETQRWAEPLNIQLSSVLADGLSPYFTSVKALPIRVGEKPDYRLVVKISEAWINENEDVVLGASWEYLDSQKNLLAAGEQKITQTGWKRGDFGNFAQKLSVAASAMAKNIGQNISGLDQTAN